MSGRYPPPTVGGVSPKTMGGIPSNHSEGDHLPRGPPQPEEGLAIHPPPHRGERVGTITSGPPPPGGSLPDGPPPPPPPCGEGGWNPGGYAWSDSPPPPPTRGGGG